MPNDEQIRLWVKQGRDNGRAVLLVVQDGADYFFPSFLHHGDSVEASIARLNGKPHTQVVRTIPI